MPARAPQNSTLRLPPYLTELARLLKRSEPNLWEWFATNRHREEAADEARLELLKTTYRVDRDTMASLYAIADEAASALGINAPITIYQAQDISPLNAGLAWIANEVHIVFYGPVVERLNEDELRALLSHELSHFLLWHDWDGEYLITEEVLRALCNQPEPHSAHAQTVRLYSLYAEIFCDRGALVVCAQSEPVITTLLKTTTGLEEVSASAYLAQADEIFKSEQATTKGLTHPEAYIRARAAKLWVDRADNVEEEITRMIEGRPALDELDLIAQERISAKTRAVIHTLLAPKSMQTDAMFAHARSFFADFTSAALQDEVSRVSLEDEHATIHKYFAYLLTDFATADPELEELPLAMALQLSRTLNIEDRFATIAQKELRLRKGQIKQLAANLEKIIP